MTSSRSRRASRSVTAGAVLAVMNVCFYSAISRLPLGTVAAIEFLPVIALAGVGVGVSSSVVPYVTDQLAMAQLPRCTALRSDDRLSVRMVRSPPDAPTPEPIAARAGPATPDTVRIPDTGSRRIGGET
jgi:hypothetical protein